MAQLACRGHGVIFQADSRTGDHGVGLEWPYGLADSDNCDRAPSGASQCRTKFDGTFSGPTLAESGINGRSRIAVMLMASVLKQLIRESSLLATSDFRSFKKIQELTFVGLNLFLLVALLLIHILFRSYFGSPPPLLVVVLIAGFLANAAELTWMYEKKFLTPDSIFALTLATIALNMAIAFALASLSYRQDIQYFALMLAPILQAAFNELSLGAISSLAVTVSTVLIFFWVWNYFRLHPPSDVNEYIEAGTISLIYALICRPAGVDRW